MLDRLRELRLEEAEECRERGCLPSLPKSPEELTPAFLTGALHACAALSGGNAVGSFESKRLGEGVGFIGIIAQLTLRYEKAEPRAPATIIAKFPSTDEGARIIGNLYGLYEREVRFYSDVAANAGLATPRCYFAAWDGEAAQSLLLLEDLSAFGHIGDQLAGCSSEEATLACTELATFHARWSDPAKLASVAWLQEGAEIIRASMTQIYPSSVPVFLDLFGSRLDASVRAAVPSLGRRVMELADTALANVPQVIAHGDYRLDNLFFASPGAPFKIAAIDWQSPNRAWGTYDVAYFMSGSMPPAERRSCEESVLRAYHETFSRNSHGSYPYAQLFDDYRRSLLVYLAIFVVNGATLELSNQRAVDLFDVIFDRLNAAILDLDALALLAG
jgi:hypothetical protein